MAPRLQVEPRLIRSIASKNLSARNKPGLTSHKKKKRALQSVEVYSHQLLLGGITSRRSPPIGLSHIPSVAFHSAPDKLLWLHQETSYQDVLSRSPSLRLSEGKCKGSKREGGEMLPAPVPGVGRRQCYLNVIKGGHQSWTSTTRRPVGRDDGVPTFLGEWETNLSRPAQ
jgi:hypothetical protein